MSLGCGVISTMSFFNVVQTESTRPHEGSPAWNPLSISVHCLNILKTAEDTRLQNTFQIIFLKDSVILHPKYSCEIQLIKEYSSFNEIGCRGKEFMKSN